MCFTVEGMWDREYAFVEDGDKLGEDSLHKEIVRTIMEGCHEGLAILDLDNNILMANKWIENRYGKDVKGKKCYEVLRGRSSACPECPLREIIETKSSKHLIQLEERRKEWFEVFLCPVTDRKDNVVAVIEHFRDITDRKILEEKLREEKKRFEDIAAHVGEWVWEVDREGRYTYSNPVVEKLLGYKPEEVIGRFFYDFFIPEEREILKEKAFEIFSKKEPFRNFLNKLMHKDGRVIIVETNGVPVLSDDGELLGYRGSDQDVTERIEAERKLRESEEKFRSITDDVMNAVDVGFLILDKNSRIVWINDTLEKFFGIRRDEIVGRDKNKVFRERIKFIFEDPEGVTKKFLSSCSEKRRSECHILPGDGRKERWLECINKPIEKGLYKGGCIELYYDITIQKRLEKRLRENIEIFKSVVEHARDAIIMIDDDGKVIFWNKCAEEMFGYKAEEIIGKDIHLLCAPKRYYDSYRRGFDLFRKSGEGEVIGKTTEVTALRKNGEEFPVELSVGAFRMKNGWHAVAIVRDISERKRMEKELKDKIEELERFYNMAVDRELRMIELKKEIDDLRRKCGEKPKYEVVEEG